MAYAGLLDGVGIYLLSPVDDVPLPVVIPDVRTAAATGTAPPRRTFRFTARPTPVDALGACVGTYVLGVDRTVRIALATSDEGPTATVEQNGEATTYALRRPTTTLCTSSTRRTPMRSCPTRWSSPKRPRLARDSWCA